MNSDFSKLPKEERDLRLTALALGELTPAEAEPVQQAIAADAEVAREFARRQQTVELVRETTGLERRVSPQGTPLRLDEARREKLLEQFKTPAPVASAVEASEAKPMRRKDRWYVPLAIAAMVIGLLTLPLMLSVPRRESKVTLLNSEIFGRDFRAPTPASDEQGLAKQEGRTKLESRRSLISGQAAPDLYAAIDSTHSALEPSVERAQLRRSVAPVLPLIADTDADPVAQGLKQQTDDFGTRRESAEGMTWKYDHLDTKRSGATVVNSDPAAVSAASDFSTINGVTRNPAPVPLPALRVENRGMVNAVVTAGESIPLNYQFSESLGEDLVQAQSGLSVLSKSVLDQPVANPVFKIAQKPAADVGLKIQSGDLDLLVAGTVAREERLSAPTPPGARPAKPAGNVYSVDAVGFVDLTSPAASGPVAANNPRSGKIALPTSATEASLEWNNYYRFHTAEKDLPGLSVNGNLLNPVPANQPAMPPPATMAPVVAGGFAVVKPEDAKDIQERISGAVNSLGDQSGIARAQNDGRFGNVAAGGSIYAGVSIPPSLTPQQPSVSRRGGGVGGFGGRDGFGSGLGDGALGIEVLASKGLSAEKASRSETITVADDSVSWGGVALAITNATMSPNRGRGDTGSSSVFHDSSWFAKDANGKTLGDLMPDRSTAPALAERENAWSAGNGRFALELPAQAKETELSLRAKMAVDGVSPENAQASGTVTFDASRGVLLADGEKKENKQLAQIVEAPKPSGSRVHFANGSTTPVVIGSNYTFISRLETTSPAAQPADSAPARPKPSATSPTPQPEVLARENPFSTFSLNVSDVSFKLAAASLEKGAMPDVASIRSEEFINAFDYRDPMPARGVPVAFAWERARYPFAHNRDVLRFSVKTAAQGRDGGKPLNIVLLLDNSGSMERADRVRIIQEALRTLATQLKPQDKLSVVTFARTASLRVDGVSGSNAVAIADQVGALTPEGGTNLEDALDLAYRTALRHYAATAINRLVLLTDGAANLGNVEPAALKAKVESFRKQGVALDCFGIGWEGFNDDLLEQLSRNGDGRYGFVNSPEEAASEFVGQLAGALRVAASDVKVQVEFNPRRVTAYRQVGYAKHQLTKEQFRDNKVDAAEISASEAGNALYMVETNPRGDGPIATVRARFRIPQTSDYREHEWVVPFGSAVDLEQSSPAVRLATSAAAFSEWLAGSPFAGEVTTDRLLGLLAGVPEVYGADPRPKRLEWMIRQAKSISGK